MKKRKPKIYGEAVKLQEEDKGKILGEIDALIKKAGISHNTNQTIKKYQKAIDLGEGIGEKSPVARAYLGLGALYQSKRKFPEAKQSYEMAQDIYMQTGEQRRVRNVQSKLAKMAEESGSLGNRFLKRIGFATAIIGFLGSVFFIRNSFTGYTIAEINQQSSSLFGVVLFLIGIVGLYFWTSRR